MRFPTVAVPVILLLAGAVYFFAKGKESPSRWTDVASPAQFTPVAQTDLAADEYDRLGNEVRPANMPNMKGLAERYNGTSSFSEEDLDRMDLTFFATFGKHLPVSTRGESAVHRAIGFDHTGRFDVALSPSQPEGVWARSYLAGKHVTFLAFRSAVPGKATGAHIHIGPPSTRRAPKS